MSDIPRKPKVAEPTDNFDTSHTYKCLRCGIEEENPVGKFYKSAWSPLYLKNDKYVPLCKSCVNEMFDDLSRKYRSDKTACILMCHCLDIPFFHSLFDSIITNNNIFSMGLYLRQINGKQYQFKCFQQTILDGELNKTDQNIREEKEVKWNISDLKNKNYVIQTLGYDCFEDESYNDEDRKFLFNTLAGYLIDDVIEDPHKCQSAIRMVKTILQSSKIDSLINAELASASPTANLKSYTDAKDKLDRNINQIAGDNGFSVKNGARSSIGANTLTGIMREMGENNYEDCKVNVFDVKMNGAFKYIADISNKSLAEQLNYQSDDFARMVATQRELIQNYEEEKLKLEEELRLIKIELKNTKELLNSDGDSNGSN